MEKTTFFSPPRALAAILKLFWGEIQTSRLSWTIIYTRHGRFPENCITRLHRTITQLLKRNGEYFTSISSILRTWRRRFSRSALEKMVEAFWNVSRCSWGERSDTQESAATILRWWGSRQLWNPRLLFWTLLMETSTSLILLVITTQCAYS